MATPSIQVKIAGDNVTALDTGSVAWTLENKIEKTYSLSSSDGQTTLDLSNVENIVSLIFTGTGNYKVEFSIGSGTNIIDFTVSSTHPFVFPTTQTFIDTLDSIKISTDSTSDITISVRVFGESVSA